MGQPVVKAGAMLQCSFGAAPSSLVVLPTNRVVVEGAPVATIMDHKPLVNIPTFGMCMSMSNPTVASATAAALGVLTPMPCVPATGTPWVPGSPTTLVGSTPVLTASSTCMCTWGGVVQVVNPGAMKTTG